jgi:hypothetical protein
MNYFLFNPFENVEGTLCGIAVDDTALNNLNIDLNTVKVIQVSSNDFNNVKFGTKIALKYSGDTVTYIDESVMFEKEDDLKKYISFFQTRISAFLNNNPTNPLFQTWTNYNTQLSTLNTSTIVYPLNMSLEAYFNSLNQPSLSPLQLP